MTDLRARIVDLALSLDGLAYPDPRYVELLMPAAFEPAANRAALAGQSSCALTVRALWRALGCAHPILRRPYRVGRAPADIEQIARDLGAWRAPSEHGIQPGDVVAVAERVPAGWAHWHTYTVVELHEHVSIGGARVVSIDGGQGVHGAGIGRRERSWPAWATSWLDVADGSPVTREVLWWADAEGLGIGA